MFSFGRKKVRNNALVTANNARKMREQNAGALVPAGFNFKANNNARKNAGALVPAGFNFEANNARKQNALVASHPLNNNKNNNGPGNYKMVNGQLVPMNNKKNNNGPKINFSQNGAPQLMGVPAAANQPKKSGGLFGRFGGFLKGSSSASANNRLKRFANAKGITNTRAYNKTTTTRNNLMNKNRVLFFNQANKKPVLAFVPMKLRDSNISAIGKILGREYMYQANGPMGPGHYNKQFVSQLAVVPAPGPVVPAVPAGPVVPAGPGPNNNNLRKRCAELMREKARIEEEIKKLGCNPKRSFLGF